jgi:hypothetical protein
MKDGQTFGQWLNWDFETNGELIIRDKNGRTIYVEDSDRYWSKFGYDPKGDIIYYENSSGVIEDKRIPEIIEHTNGRKYKLIK